jgi:hypothetical protein
MDKIPRWTYQDVRLYHGTTKLAATDIVESGVDVAKGRSPCDFGPGFYCTTVGFQARIWAERKAILRNEEPAVVEIAMPRQAMARLNFLAFVLAVPEASDFWSFVRSCRSSADHGFYEPKQSGAAYDIVLGPVAANWKTCLARPGSDQVSFHTETAQNGLNISATPSIINS